MSEGVYGGFVPQLVEIIVPHSRSQAIDFSMACKTTREHLIGLSKIEITRKGFYTTRKLADTLVIGA